MQTLSISGAPIMDFIKFIIDFIIHIDIHLGAIITQYGAWTYLILFLIIFCETGLVVTPFLPGDSLLFAAGALCAMAGSPLDITTMVILLCIAAILGDTVNYWIGHKVGPDFLKRSRIKLINQKHLDVTHAFYEKHGGKTIALARFIPIIRTFAPFVAGIGSMNYSRFMIYNVSAGIGWVVICSLAGFFFGNLPIVKENFTAVIFAIIGISILPPIFEFVRHKIKSHHK